MKKSVLIVIVFVAAVLAAILYTTLTGSTAKYRVKICMTFQGHTECQTSRASTHNEALRSAVDTACSLIARGQSEFERCRNTPPASEQWLNGE